MLISRFDLGLIAYIILVIAYTPTHGFFSFGGAILILISLFTLVSLLKRKADPITNHEGNLAIVLFVSIALALVYYGGLYQKGEDFKMLNQTILGICLAVSYLYLHTRSSIFTFIFKYKYQFLLITAILLRFFMIRSSPSPIIDVFDQLKYGSLGMVSLQNPYQMTFPKIYTVQNPTSFAYLPGSLFFLAPFVILLNDPRYGIALGDIGFAIVLYLLLKKSDPIKGQLLSLIYLFNPMSLFVIEQSWLDPLTAFFIAIFIYTFIKNKNSIIPFILIGFGMSIKQNIAIFFPIALIKLELKLKQVIWMALIPLVIIVPFILWSPTDFWHDQTAGFNPSINSASSLANYSLNINSFFSRFSSLKLSNIQSLVAIIFISSFMLIKTKRGLENFFYCFLIIMFTITLLFFQAFLNYFTFISTMILLFLAINTLEQPKQRST